MRSSRLLSLLLLLQTRGGMTASELASELEVSIRTIYRDVEALSQAGVPIYAERGPGGGVRLVEGYRTRLTGLNQDEADAVFLSALPGPAAELGLGTVVAAARLKVLAALPPELRARASRIAERFHLDAPGWFQAAEPVPHLEALAGAVWDARAVEIHYDRGDRTVERVVEPLGLVLKGGVWYLVARAAEQLRTYRISRVVDARVLDGRFERPPVFDLAEFWADSTAAYERSLPTVDATLRVAEHRLSWLAEELGPGSMETAVISDDHERQGWKRIDVRLESIRHSATVLIQFGGDVEVVAPAELRDQLLDFARAVLQRHAAAA